MKRIGIVSILLVFLLISFLGITYSLEYDNAGVINFTLNGPSPLYMGVNTDYQEYGITVYDNGKDVSRKVKIDKSGVDSKKIGEYKVKYSYKNEYIYRDVIIIDNTKPVIELVGGN